MDRCSVGKVAHTIMEQHRIRIADNRDKKRSDETNEKKKKVGIGIRVTFDDFACSLSSTELLKW